MNEISPKWIPFAKGWLGNKDGKHCHWCKFAEFDEGEVTCGNPKSKFCDGDRIRSWDGLGCAEECGLFEISDWYTKDENFETTFPKESE
jgi:hypothetical protein